MKNFIEDEFICACQKESCQCSNIVNKIGISCEYCEKECEIED